MLRVNEPCRCGAAKNGWQAFCATCFAKLPQHVIDALNRRKAGAHREAETFLDAREAVEEAKRERLRTEV